MTGRDWMQCEAGDADPQAEQYLRAQGWEARGPDCWSRGEWSLRRQIRIKLVWTLWRGRCCVGSSILAQEADEYRLRHQEPPE